MTVWLDVARRLDLRVFGGARAGLCVAAREGLEGTAQSGIRHADEWLTGARRRPRDILDDPARTRWAEDAYADFMRDSRDIDAISIHTQGLARDNGATGFSSQEITAIKKHVFDTEHPIKDYETGKVVVRKFDADAEIADAWIRLRSGNSLPEDRLLLEHELAELAPSPENPGATYQEAHRVAIETHNWQDSVPLNKREGFGGVVVAALVCFRKISEDAELVRYEFGDGPDSFRDT
ncbi:hypothetical protein OHA98_00650 [Streptomyces sp. NBC_00654]|uniref:hypothetical protein n=1 Tax=Streptomyces sp. NBC_00654 TaxID=2975799 RepID=UPI00224E2975|nr:hypothetical protein [Streptomyces sp. NBC_00654]MCX4963344.1 hypothetical protein [Streptomyces sp. NBC_00654]